MRQHRIAELVWQPYWRQHVDPNPKQLGQFVSNGADIEQRRFRRRVYEDVQVTVIRVYATRHRSEDTSIARPMGFNYAANGGSVELKSS